MDNHGNNKSDSGMIWMMAICCMMPILFVILFSGGARSLGVPAWLIFGGMALYGVFHFVRMRQSHKHHDEKSDAASENHKADNSHTDHSCCH